MVARRESSLRTVLVGVVAAGLGLTACSGDGDVVTTDPGAPPPPEVVPGDLDGRTFTSTAITEDGVESTDVEEVVLEFEGDEVSGNAGCNGVGAAYTLEDGVLQAGEEMASTEMFCDTPIDLDAWLRDLLASGPQLTLDGPDLTVTGEDVTVELTEQSG